MPRRDRDEIEAKMVARGLTGRRVTRELIEEKILRADYHRFPDTTVTICLLTLENGFTVIGQSACADPANFRRDMGEDLALADAKDKIWQLEGYLLRQLMHNEAGLGLSPP